MRGVAKMAVLNAARNGGEMRGAYNEMRGAYGGMENEMRSASTSMEAMGHYPPMWQEPESRRRDSRGRFVRSEMMGNNTNTTETMRYEARFPGERQERYPEERAPMQIGFRYDEDMSRYKSDAGYPRMNESEHRRSQMDKGFAKGLGIGKLDKQTADDWVNAMVTVDGYKGKRWGMEQAKQVMMQHGIDCDPLEFYVAMNMMYSDYGKIAEEMGMDNVDFYAKMAQAFLKDPDAVKDKLMAYYSAIAK